ncbi:peptide deformylase [bacterium]|nr:peptide deformylase [bacterium]
MELLTTRLEQDLKKLREISRALTPEEITSSRVQQLIANLVQFAQNYSSPDGHYKCAGLSAVQVGFPLRIYVVRDRKTEVFTPYINPGLTPLGDATNSHVESCLSIPNVSGIVERYTRVRLSYLDPTGQRQMLKEVVGFTARVLQHEQDHLDGILFTDRMSKPK